MKPKRTPEEIKERGDRDQAMPMIELAEYTGYSYHKVREFAARDGFPRRLGLVVPSEFRAWLLTQPVDTPVATPVQAAA